LEIQVHDKIVNILNNFQNTRSMSVLKHNYVLDFADPSEPQIVEYITAAEKDGNNFESKECIIDDKDEEVEFNYKRKL